MIEYSRRYYLMYKDRFRLNYLDKRRLNDETQEVEKNYYYNYYKSLSSENLRFKRLCNFISSLYIYNASNEFNESKSECEKTGS